MTSKVFWLLILLAGSLSEALADQITLKNGDRVSGTVIRADGKSIIFKSDLIGEITVGLDNVSTITTEKPLYATLADGRAVLGVISTSGDKAEIRPNAAPVVAVSRSEIQFIRSEEEQRAYERSLHPGWLEQWSGGADLGAALTAGNSDTLSVALGLALSRVTSRDKTTVYAASIYNRDNTGGDSRTVANTIRGGLRYDRDINRKWFGYGFTDLEHNGLQDLTLRLVLGGGVGYHLIRNERTEMDLLGGLDWNREYFKGDFNDRSTAEVQLGETLSHRFNSRVSLKQQLFIFPNLTEGGEYRINFDGSLITDISRHIAWQLTLSDRYLSNPPVGFEKNDLLLTTGLKIKLGPPAK